MISDTSWVCKAREWKGLQSLVKIEPERYHKSNGDSQKEIRYYISSLAADAAQTTVFKLQKRIYRASQKGHHVLVRKLQRLPNASFCAKLLSVRKVTQENKGKKTANVDGKTALTSKERKELVQSLNGELKTMPIRRVWIDKPGKTEKRPQGIPTIRERERARQTLIKMTLEPQWEAKFEPNSYGFRSGRSCHDAIQAIFQAIKCKHAYVLDQKEICFNIAKVKAVKIGLELKPEKTRLGHTLLKTEDVKPGFNFPGFNIRQFTCHDRVKGYKLIIRPGREVVMKHSNKLKAEVRNHRAVNQEKLIKILNPIIRGWCNYYQYVVSCKTLYRLNNMKFRKVWGWACYRHNRRSKKWIRKSILSGREIIIGDLVQETAGRNC